MYVRSSSRPALRLLFQIVYFWMTGLHLLLLFGESTITAANKYSAFGCKSGYKSKGGEQGQNSPFTLIQFMTRICALNGWKLIIAKTMCHVPSSHSLSTRALHTIVDVYTLHCHHCKVCTWSNSYAIWEDEWNTARYKMTSTSLVRNNQLPIFFMQCCYP